MLLADIASRPEAYKIGAHAAAEVNAARKFVMRDSALEAAAALRASPPAKMNQLRMMAVPPFDSMFIEYDINAYRKSYGGEERHEEQGAMSAILVTDKKNGTMSVDIFDAISPMNRNSTVLRWPIRYIIKYNDDAGPFLLSHEYRIDEGRHRMGTPSYDAAVWGYTALPEMKPLSNTCIAISTINYSEYNDTVIKLLKEAIKETSGIARHAVAVLALMNGPAERIPSDVAGRIIIHGKTHRAATAEFISVRLPKRHPDYPKQLFNACREAHRKRLHDVRGHYRYLKRQPVCPNWERVEIEGETFWRRWIASHERGNAEADANKTVAASLTSELVRYKQAQKWDGKLPAVTGGATPIIDLR